MSSGDSQKKISELIQQMEVIKNNLSQMTTNQVIAANHQVQASSYKSSHYTPYNHAHVYRGGRGRGYRTRSRGHYRGGYKGHANTARGSKVRNMSLLIDNNHADKHESEGASSTGNQGYVSTVTGNAMTLVNKEIFDKELQDRLKRAKIIELKKKILKKQIENKVLLAGFNKNKSKYDYCDWTHLYGPKSEATSLGYGLYAVVGNGKKLAPLSLDPRSEELGAKVEYNGHEYIRSSGGVLVNISTPSEQEYCHYYTAAGACQRYAACQFKHSKDHVALCRRFISHKCPESAASCQLSHTPNQFNSPTCLFFLNGYCAKGDECIFGHVMTNPDAHICRPFALGGWCDRGLSCTYKHIYDCPDFVDYNGCLKGKACKLNHPKKRNDDLKDDKMNQNRKIKSEGEISDKVDMKNISEILDFSSSDDEEEEDDDDDDNESDGSDDGEEKKREESSQERIEQNEDKTLELNQDYVSL
ncbi:hypothetical protein DASC09_054470 [Saccharomycopsis crataegensis]|uniref:C3H1-type domain-containing protein n=1 Tax=Saccharomycopsis crataegensis TaxID=43959 RepID=A0AAV5QUP7_9ASCO|nr:hypothetical protein DASC09_054470 [Saccharomycopsis crataegensis]